MNKIELNILKRYQVLYNIKESHLCTKINELIDIIFFEDQCMYNINMISCRLDHIVVKYSGLRKICYKKERINEN